MFLDDDYKKIIYSIFSVFFIFFKKDNYILKFIHIKIYKRNLIMNLNIFIMLVHQDLSENP